MANTTFGAPLELRESLKLGHGTTDPYAKRSPELASYAEGLTNIPVRESFSVPEAASVFDVWMKDEAIPRSAYYPVFLRHGSIRLIPSPTRIGSGDELFMSKYSEASGNPRDFVWKGILATMAL